MTELKSVRVCGRVCVLHVCTRKRVFRLIIMQIGAAARGTKRRFSEQQVSDQPKGDKVVRGLDGLSETGRDYVRRYPRSGG